MNRRSFLTKTGALPNTLGKSNRPAAAANDAPETNAPYSHVYPDMLVKYLAGKLNALAVKWDHERAATRTKQQIEARNRFVLQKTAEMIHGLRPQRPLRSRIVKSFEREGYRVENILLETRPDYWIPGNLYVPTRGKGPYPGIVSPCGHEVPGRMYVTFQCAHTTLAREGFVVWTYDPPEEGERRHYWNPMTGQNEIGGPVTWAHELEGQLLILIGEALTHYRIWDGMCGVDFLSSRPEVDPKRIGCTGQSGGGLYTVFLTALDSRIACGASNQGGCENRWPIELGPYSPLDLGDIDQQIFPAAIYGIDQADFLMGIAPRPMLMTTSYFDTPFNKLAETVRERYRLLGAPEKFAIAASEDPHFWTVKLRLASVDWLCRWFYGRPGPKEEPPFRPEPAENLYCTVNGSMDYSQRGQTIISLLFRKQAKLPPERPLPTTPAALDEYRAQMRSDIKRMLRWAEASQPVAPRAEIMTPRKGYRVEKLAFLSEPGIYVPTWVFIPDKYQGRKPAVVFASDAGLEDEGLEFGTLEGLVRHGHMLVAVDVRGIGLTQTQHPSEEVPGRFHQVEDAEEVFTHWAWHMDECLFGMRVRDVLCSVDYALTRSEVDPQGVMAVGRGMGALWVLYAAALDDRIRSAVCYQGLLSYRALTSVDRYTHESSVFVRDVLTAFDLPQVAAAAAPRRLTILEPWGPMKSPVEISEATKAYQWTRDVYAAARAPAQFLVASRDPVLPLADQCWNLLKANEIRGSS